MTGTRTLDVAVNHTMRLSIATIVLALIATACTADPDSIEESVNDPAPVVTTAGLIEESAGLIEEDAGAVEEDPPIGPSYAGTVPAPAFPINLDWLNTADPIVLSDLHGKIVLLDFWTYGCINCIHIIPDLERLEEEYADELVVIGVHSAKFVNESATENIRQVVLRYGLEHPVVNDGDFQIWQTWGAQAWPTIALIDPAGNVVGMQAGEGVYQTVQPVIDALVAEFDRAGLIDRTPFEVSPESENQANTILSYPGKVATDATGDRIFVSDTGHNRIVAADPASGEILAVYGNGQAGLEDGPALSARFDAPQGLAYDAAAAILYVADTNNHAIRVIDLDNNNQVSTLVIEGLAPPDPPRPEQRLTFPNAQQIDVDLATVKTTGGSVLLSVELQLPEGYKLNPAAPMGYVAEAAGDEGPIDRQAVGRFTRLDTPSTRFDIRLPVTADQGSDTVTISTTYYYCRTGAEGLCKVASAVWTVPLKLDSQASDDKVLLRANVLALFSP